MKILALDFETRSDIDLIKRGVYVYVESPHTDALMASYRFDNGPLLRWRRGEPCPADIVAHVEAGGAIKAHNAAFERLMWNLLADRHGWPRPALEQFHCTAVTAAAMSLPRSLDRLGAALDLKVTKDKRGRSLIKKHSLPQDWKDGLPVFDEDPAGLADFHDYCDGDVLTESEAGSRLIPLSTQEQAVYVLNERINDRGIRLDVVSARAAVQLAAKAKAKLDAEMCEATAGFVPACTNVKALTAWIAAQGVEIETVGKDDIDELLHTDDLPERVRTVLEIRQEAAKTSVSKIDAMLDRACADQRMRGTYLHHGAGQTGRFSSRGFQAHNLPKYRKVYEDAHLNLEALFDAIRSGDPDVLELLYGPELGRPLHLLSDAVRGFLWAAPGFEFVGADYSSIEGRMAAWFAGEAWKVDAYYLIDSGQGGPGIYERTAAGILGLDPAAVTKRERPIGKVAELALGYQGGVGALARMARSNKLKLHTVYDVLAQAVEAERLDRALERYEERIEKHDDGAIRMGREAWVAGELIKVGWRAQHPAITNSWALLEEAAGNAVADPGVVYQALTAAYVVRHGFLWCRLPSGRCLAYGAPELRETEAPWADKTLAPEKREKKLSITVCGVDSQTEKWTRFPIYGGSLFNNVIQGSARDILVHGMFKAEAAGIPLVLHTHDEMAGEVRKGTADVKAFERLICELPEWASGLPLAAAGWRGKRYRKD